MSDKNPKEYVKDFDIWHPKKKAIDLITLEKVPYFNNREIWFCVMGCNVGYEQDGKGEEFIRPVVIIKKYNAHLFTGVPLTSKIKKFPFYFSVGDIDEQPAMAILSQVRSFSSKRLVNKLGMMNKDIFEGLKKAASEYLFSD